MIDTIAERINLAKDSEGMIMIGKEIPCIV